MPDVDTLIQHYLEGSLTEAEAAELHALLQASPDLGERLLQHLELDAMLRATRPVVPRVISFPALLPKPRFGFAALAGAAAAAAAVTLLISSFFGRPAEVEKTTSSVAVLTRGVHLVWESPSIAPGTPLTPGWLRFASGIAQIEFYSGARVLIEGPAAIELLSSTEANCTRGKLSANVPPQAKGFRIHTPKGTIVDLGTEFGLEVDGSAAAAVHVFKGEVELHRASEAMRSLKEGQAMEMALASKVVPANAASFASLGEIDARSALSERSQFEEWSSTGARLNGQEGLRLRFDFQDDHEARTLRNLAAGKGSIPDGSIVGASWTQGRWPGKQALEFRNVSDRVRLSVPGETKALTLAMWVRIHGLDRSLNSLFMSEGWGDRRLHWQITRGGQIRLGVAGPPNQSHRDYDTPVFFTPERFGRWTHLAVVFDPERGEVRHYADGTRLATHRLHDASPLKIGTAELGNWNENRRPQNGNGVAIRHLSGAMDEFALWDRALGDWEVEALAR